MVRSGRDVLERFNNTDHSLLLKDTAQPSYCVIWTVMGCLPFSHFVFCFGEIVTAAAEAGSGILLNHCISHLHQWNTLLDTLIVNINVRLCSFPNIEVIWHEHSAPSWSGIRPAGFGFLLAPSCKNTSIQSLDYSPASSFTSPPTCSLWLRRPYQHRETKELLIARWRCCCARLKYVIILYQTSWGRCVSTAILPAEWIVKEVLFLSFQGRKTCCFNKSISVAR